MARRKSAFVVEVEPSGVQWVKSSASGSGSDECVEVAFCEVVTLVRDSKDRSGPHLSVSASAWLGLLGAL